MILERRAYTLELAADGLHATLRSPTGEHWLTLTLLAAFDRTDAVDETLAVAAPSRDGDTISVERTSTIWEQAAVQLVCRDEELELAAWVAGQGRLTDVHLLGGRSLIARGGTGFLPTGSSFRTLFSPNPGDPARLVRAASESAVLGASGDAGLGRGHWFFTPPPLVLGLSLAADADPDAGEWLGLGLVAPVEELTFVQAAYRPSDTAFHLVLEHEGHTTVAGRHDAPRLVLAPGAPDAYATIRRHAAPPRAGAQPAWWRDPIFCGWGAQCHLGRLAGAPAPSFATQENYDAFLGALAAHDVVPPTVVIDDKWQQTYGLNEPDEAKWPDLRGWIDARHDEGRHVLLWWKAWDPEGLPPELCIRTPAGGPVALDPTQPEACELLRGVVRSMLAPDGLAADGLKIDFTARTPSGHALTANGDGWGIALLHRLLSVVYSESKAVNPESLVITQTPNPSFADVTDMVRLNDMLRLDDPGPRPAHAVVEQMRYRARVTAAALPGLPIDTDDWCVPDKATWRAYLEAKPSLGVPSLYYATHLDLSGEPLEDDDYAAIRRSWEASA